MRKLLTFCVAATAALLLTKPATAQTLTMNDLGYFEARGTNVLVYNNLYNGGFYDEKFAGLEIIQRGERLATGGGIRLMNTPEQWDIFGTVSDRIVDCEGNFVQVTLTHTDYDFAAKLRVTPKDGGCLVQVILDKPVPENLVGKAGLNLEFFPASYSTRRSIRCRRRSRSTSARAPSTTAAAATSSWRSPCPSATRSCWPRRTRRSAWA